MSSEHEIDLVALWWIVWDHKYLVAATTVICTLVALYLALTAVPVFQAEVEVAQVQETGIGGGNSLASQFGGLAGLAGMNLGQNGPELERQAFLESRHLVEEFIQRNGVMSLMYAKAPKKPSLWFAVVAFKKDVLAINEDKVKGVTTITMDWTDPAVAARWANSFVALANELLRNRALTDSSRNIAYLNGQIEHMNSVEVQRVMYNLIEQETKTLMLANGRVEYGFTVVDPAVTPEVRIRPRRTVMVASGIAVGLFLGAIVAWGRTRFARPKLVSHS